MLSKRRLTRDREAQAQSRQMRELRARYDLLTAREREVMMLVVRGLMNKQIAGQLGTTEATVKLHRGRVMHKMQADSLADLIRMAEKLEAPGCEIGAGVMRAVPRHTPARPKSSPIGPRQTGGDLRGTVETEIVV